MCEVQAGEWIHSRVTAAEAYAHQVMCMKRATTQSRMAADEDGLKITLPKEYGKKERRM